MTIAVAEPAGLSAQARAYVALVTASGAILLVAFLPRALPPPAMFLFLLLASCVTSAWKINLPMSLSSGSTLSVSYAANLMALLLLGPRSAMVIAALGVWTQCTFNVKRRYPVYRTAFSIAAEVVTMSATATAYGALGGTTGPTDVGPLLRPIVGAVATYFFVNTGLVAAAIGLSSDRAPWSVWRGDLPGGAPRLHVPGGGGPLGGGGVA